MSLQAFGPRGLTANISANGTASAAVRVRSTPPGHYTYQFVNSGGNKCWFASGNGVVVVAIPTPGAPANGIPILANEIVVYNLSPDAFFSVICETGSVTTLEISVGEGM